ncbi:MAG: hypothetical protein ACKOAF_05455 [Actinomycetes bacterium]
MATSSDNVLVGTPDQSVSGAILCAVKGTALPANASATLNAAFADAGYVSEDGITITPARSTKNIKDWSASTVRTVLESFDGTISWTQLEVNTQSLKNTFGDAYVTETPANGAHGKQVTVGIGAHEMPIKSWAFKIKDGSKKVLVIVPNGQITEAGDIAFKSGEAVTLPVTLSCYPDSVGNSIYIHTDDGITTGV